MGPGSAESPATTPFLGTGYSNPASAWSCGCVFGSKELIFGSFFDIFDHASGFPSMSWPLDAVHVLAPRMSLDAPSCGESESIRLGAPSLLVRPWHVPAWRWDIFPRKPVFSDVSVGFSPKTMCTSVFGDPENPHGHPRPRFRAPSELSHASQSDWRFHWNRNRLASGLVEPPPWKSPNPAPEHKSCPALPQSRRCTRRPPSCTRWPWASVGATTAAMAPPPFSIGAKPK